MAEVIMNRTVFKYVWRAGFDVARRTGFIMRSCVVVRAVYDVICSNNSIF
jgi:hypothetical protein